MTRASEKESIASRILNSRPQYVYVVVLLAQILPITIAGIFATPITVSQVTQDAFDLMETLQPGDVVFLYDSVATMGYPLPCHPGSIVMYTHLLRTPGIKIVQLFSSVDSYTLFSSMISPELQPEFTAGGWEYGVDWVNLGWVVGGEKGFAAVLDDIRSVISVDVYGTPLDDLPVMDGINEATDFDRCVTIWGHDFSLRQFWSRNPTHPVWMNVGAVHAPAMMPYYKAGQAVIVNDIAGAAEYEQLLGIQKIGTTSMAMLNSTTAVCIIFIVIANIAFFYDRQKRE